MSAADYAPLDRMPPQSREAERGVLGSVLRDNVVLNDLLNIIQPDNFYYDAHQKIFQAILDIYNDGKPVDLTILYESLKQRKQVEDIGGAGYIAELWDAAPTAANAEYYAKIVRDKAVIRNLIHATTELLRDSYDGVMSADELLSTAERKVLEIAERGTVGVTKTLGDALIEAFNRIDAKAAGQHADSGIPTGFVDLDNLTAGLQKNELIIVAARPSVGKTAFALNLIRHIVVEERMPALFISLEQAKVELAERLLCSQARVDSHKVRKGNLAGEDIRKLIEANEVLKGNKDTGYVKLFLDDAPQQTMLRIAANARRLKLRHDLRIVVIDYLQLIEPEDRKAPRQEQVAQISRRLKFLARELQIPVVALAQVNRGSEDRQDHTPRLSDLRESGSIEQDADTVLMLHRPARFDKSQEDNILEVHIAKQRNGPTGQITLTYLREYMRYENYAADLGTAGYP
jgi:replicative DNA helicase